MKLIYENEYLKVYEVNDNLDVEVNLETRSILFRRVDGVTEVDIDVIEQLSEVLKCS